MKKPQGLGEKLTITPTPDSAELQTPRRSEIETEIQFKLTLLHNGMNGVRLHPADDTPRRQGLISPYRVSRSVEYQLEDPVYSPESKAWIEHNKAPLARKGQGTELATKQITAWLQTKSIRTNWEDNELGIDLMTQTTVTSPKTRKVYLKGDEKVRATALPSTANTPISTLEGLNVRDLSSYNLQQLFDMRDTLDRALETVFMILGEDIDLSYRQNPAGKIAVRSIVSLAELTGADSRSDETAFPEPLQAEA